MEQTQEKELVGRAKEGDVSAFEDLISRHQARVYNIAFHFSGNATEAGELSQEVLIKAFKSVRTFRGDCAFSTWLYRVARSVFLDERKSAGYKKSILQTTSLDGEEESPVLTLAGPDNPLKEIETRELQSEVQTALRQLPREFGLSLILYYLEGFSYEEICQITRSSMGTVKSRLNRGREKLKEVLIKKVSN